MKGNELNEYLDDLQHAKRARKADVVAELAQALNVKSRSVFRWIETGKIPAKYHQELTEYISDNPVSSDITGLAKSLVEHFPLPCALIDKRLRYIAASTSYVDAFDHHKKAPLEGRSVFDTIPKSLHDLARSQYAQALSGESVYINDGIEYETEAGRVVEFSFEMHPWLDGNKRIEGVFLVANVAEKGQWHDTNIWQRGDGGSVVENTYMTTGVVDSHKSDKNSILDFSQSLASLAEELLMHIPLIEVGAEKKLLAIAIPIYVRGEEYEANVIMNVRRAGKRPQKKKKPPKDGG